MMPEDRRHAGAEEPVLSAAHLARFLACAHALHRDLAAPEASAHSADPAMSVTAARARLRAGAAQVKGLTLGAAAGAPHRRCWNAATGRRIWGRFTIRLWTRIL